MTTATRDDLVNTAQTAGWRAQSLLRLIAGGSRSQEATAGDVLHAAELAIEELDRAQAALESLDMLARQAA